MSDEMICLEEEANVAVKHVFRAELLNAIAKNDKEAFKTLVEQIGKDWHVSRTVETEAKDTVKTWLFKENGHIMYKRGLTPESAQELSV